MSEATESPSSSALLSPAPVTASQAPRQDGADAMAAALVERGTWTQEQAAAALANVDAEPTEGGTLDPSISASIDARGLQGALISQGVDEPTAKFFGEMLRKATLNPPDLATRQAASAATVAHLRAPWPDGWGEHYDMMLDLVGSEIALLSQSFPKLPEMLRQSGLYNNPTIMRTLAKQGLDRAAKRRLGTG